MSEFRINCVEQEDIRPPVLTVGATSVVLQRHEAYERDATAENAGSIIDTSAYDTDFRFFTDLLDQEKEGSATIMVLMVSSDTQYAGKGYRSIETTNLALHAAETALQEHGIDPRQRIINLNPNFYTHSFEATNNNIRP